MRNSLQLEFITSAVQLLLDVSLFDGNTCLTRLYLPREFCHLGLRCGEQFSKFLLSFSMLEFSCKMLFLCLLFFSLAYF